jgi:hypothetical protein
VQHHDQDARRSSRIVLALGVRVNTFILPSQERGTRNPAGDKGQCVGRRLSAEHLDKDNPLLIHIFRLPNNRRGPTQHAARIQGHGHLDSQLIATSGTLVFLSRRSAGYPSIHFAWLSH